VGWQQQIALRIGRGEAAALEELYDRLAGQVYRIALVMTSSIPAAEQVTEAVFLEVWRRPHAVLRHQHQLADFLTHQACQMGALWRAQHAAERRQQASPQCTPTEHAGGRHIARVWARARTDTLSDPTH
jgi:RNA polymerase sigma-70 factor, ECF subfamily